MYKWTQCTGIAVAGAHKHLKGQGREIAGLVSWAYPATGVLSGGLHQLQGKDLLPQLTDVARSRSLPLRIELGHHLSKRRQVVSGGIHQTCSLDKHIAIWGKRQGNRLP